MSAPEEAEGEERREVFRTAFFAAGDFLAEEERFFFGISEVLLLPLLHVRSKFRPERSCRGVLFVLQRSAELFF